MCWTGGTRQRVHPTGFGSVDRTLTQPAVLKDGYSLCRCRRPLSVSPDGGRRAQDTAPALQSSFKVGKLGDEFGILEDDRCIHTGVFQRRYLVHELVFACSPPPPPRPQISHTILAQAGVPSRQDRGDRSPSALALIGAWMHLRLRKETTFRSDGPCWSLPVTTQRTKQVCVRGGRSSANLLQPFPSNPILGCIVSPGAQHAMD